MSDSVAGKFSAKQLLALLAKRHARDLFFDEVKDGPTIRRNGQVLRLDARAIPKSYPISLYGYEIKVRRSDWLSDNKWEAYLPFANYFSLVTSPGVLDISELPDGIGLLVASSNGTMLRTVRKPARRDVAPDPLMMHYLLISRCEPSTKYRYDKMTRAERIAEWKESLADGKALGHKIRTLVSARTAEMSLWKHHAQEVPELDTYLRNKGHHYGRLVQRVMALEREQVAEVERARESLEVAAARVAQMLDARVVFGKEGAGP